MFDFRHYLDMLIEDKQMIDKINNQAQLKLTQDQLSLDEFLNITHAIEVMKTVLKKNNQKVWFLRIVSAYIDNTLDSTLLGTYNFTSPVELIDKLNEYYNQDPPINSIEQFPLNRQPVSDVLEFFNAEKEKYTKEQSKDRKRGVARQHGDYPIFKFQGDKIIPYQGTKEFDELPFDYAWWWIDRAFCSEEARSGGHCGNIAGKYNPDQRILSFRNNLNQVQLTFIREPDGTLGEMRANFNLKPDPFFHPYIMPLLMWNHIKGIKGAPYGLQSAFSIFDLDADQIEYLHQHKQKLIRDQIKITPFEILKNNVPEHIKKIYLGYATIKQPAIKNLINNNTFEQWDKEIKTNKSLVLYLPEEFIPQYPNYLDLLIKRIEVDPLNLLQVPRSVSRNFDYLKPIITKVPVAIVAVSEYVKRYNELAELAFNKNNEVFIYIAENFRTPKMCMKAVTKHPHLLEHVPEKIQREHPEIYKTAVRDNGGTLSYVPEDIRKKDFELCKSAVSDYPPALQYVPDNIKLTHPEICKLAVSKDGYTLQDVPNEIKQQYPELYKMAVIASAGALHFVPEELRTMELCKIAIDQDGANIQDVPPALITTFIEQAFDSLRNSWHDLDYGDLLDQIPENQKTPDVYAIFLKEDGRLITHVPMEQRSLELCKIAVNSNANAIHFVPEHLRDKITVNTSNSKTTRLSDKSPAELKKHFAQYSNQNNDFDDDSYDDYDYDY